MTRFLMISTLAVASLSTAAFAADTKEQSCAYQAAIVAAVQAARVDGVKERQVSETLLGNDPSWPEGYNAAIPIIAPWVYEQKRRDLKTKDLGAAWSELCLQQ